MLKTHTYNVRRHRHTDTHALTHKHIHTRTLCVRVCPRPCGAGPTTAAVASEKGRGFTALTLLITFLSGMNLFFLGVIGEYVGRVYEEVKGRPLYFVNPEPELDIVTELRRQPSAAE